MNASSGTDWRANEIAMVDGCIRAGISPGNAHSMFPGRSLEALKTQYHYRRRHLQIPATRGRPVLPETVMAPAIDSSVQDSVARRQAINGSRALLSATQAMFERKAGRLNASIEAVAIATMFSHEQIARRVKAAA